VFLINAFLNNCPYSLSTGLRSGLLGDRISGVKSGVLCEVVSQQLGALVQAWFTGK